MPSSQNLTRQRLIHAALELFTAQGVTTTTTKQIAEAADVNEVTLFRHFGSKNGLLLAVIEESAVFTQLGQTLIQQADQTSSIYRALKDYATACLQAMERVPEVVRSVVGEAGQFPAENRAALGRGFTQANHDVAKYFETVIQRGQLHSHLPAEKLASLLNGMLLGYAVIEFTSEFHNLWQDRNDFLENLVTLFLHGAVSPAPDLTLSATRTDTSDASATGASSTDVSVPTTSVPTTSVPTNIVDLPTDVVHRILQRAKKLGLQEYALAYVLFGAGLSPAEIVRLERYHYFSDTQHQHLQVIRGSARKVPVNQWIMGKRYGSHKRNPLTQWLKSRKDKQSALFVNASGDRLSEQELEQYWQVWTEELLNYTQDVPTIAQAQQTWCIDMLSRGMSIADLSILTGWNTTRLQPYAERVRDKVALEQAIRLDQKV